MELRHQRCTATLIDVAIGICRRNGFFHQSTSLYHIRGIPPYKVLSRIAEREIRAAQPGIPAVVLPYVLTRPEILPQPEVFLQVRSRRLAAARIIPTFKLGGGVAVGLEHPAVQYVVLGTFTDEIHAFTEISIKRRTDGLLHIEKFALRFDVQSRKRV